MVETNRASTTVAPPSAVPRLVGQCERMQQLRTLIETVASRDCTVLIQGESGTGKEMVAQQIHAHSGRVNESFVAVDCTNLQDTLFESQLFGHVRGSFTGAERDTIGFFRAADEGSLFLDEIGEMNPRAQAKLLRCIQERAVVPVGGVEPIPVDVRIIAATHRNLVQLVRQGQFREDLYYRLNVICLEVPPLRARQDDIVPLAEYFLEQIAMIYQEEPKRLAADAREALLAHHWPGNVRELANAIEHAFVLSRTPYISATDLPATLWLDGAKQSSASPGQVVPLEVAERSLIAEALQATEGNQSLAAQMLGIERRRLYRKVRRYGLQNLTRFQRELD